MLVLIFFFFLVIDMKIAKTATGFLASKTLGDIVTFLFASITLDVTCFFGLIFVFFGSFNYFNSSY